MSLFERAVFLFIVFHLVCLSVDAFKPPDDLSQLPPPSNPVGFLASILAPVLDATYQASVRPAAAVSKVLVALEPLAARYVRTLSIEQRWNMFSNVDRHAEYVRLSFVIVKDAARDGSRQSPPLRLQSTDNPFS
jgi:hypothetical protein